MAESRLTATGERPRRNEPLTRRDLIRLAGATSLAAGMTGLGIVRQAEADPAQRPDAKPGAHRDTPDGHPAAIEDGRVFEPEQTVPVLHQTDVLVVGAGPAGVCAALAARRTGASVTLAERYGHFGGQWTGGLVLEVAGMHAAGGKQVVRGLGEEILRRADKLDRAIIDRRPGVNATVDAEALKYVMVEMVVEAGIDCFLHCWGVDAICRAGVVQGAVVESKSGHQAILARAVVDATGDGDLFAAAGAEHETMKYHVGLVCRIGNLDKIDPDKARGARPPRHLGAPTPISGVHWVNMHGPEADALDVRELTRLELNHRRQIWRQVEAIRRTPGYEEVYLVETAPQLGVRMSRLLSGTARLTLEDVKSGRPREDRIGVGGDWTFKQGPWHIPYGVLVPRSIDGLLAAGRCISGEPGVCDFVRIIPTCFVTGHAAGTAAALAARQGCPPREVEVAGLQKTLREQDAYLG